MTTVRVSDSSSNEVGARAHREASATFLVWAPALLVLVTQLVQILLVVGQARSWSGASDPIPQALIRRQVVIQGILPIPIVIAALMSRRPRPSLAPVERRVFFLLPVAAMALLVGLIYGNPPVLVLGDAYQLLIVPVGYFALRMDGVVAERAARHLVLVLAALSFVWLIVEFYYFNRLGRAIPFSTTAYLIPLFYVLAKTAIPFALRVSGALMMVVGIALTFKRTLYILVVIGLVLLLRQRERRFGYIAVVFAVIGGILVLVPREGQLSPIEQLRSRTVDSFQTAAGVPALPESAQERLEEASSVFSSLRESDSIVLAELLGKGLGSSVQLRGQPRHTVHITVVTFLYRTGIIGLLLVLVWVTAFLHWLWQKKGLTPRPEIALPILVALTVHLMAGLFASYVVWKDFDLLAMASILGGLRRSQGSQPNEKVVSQHS